MSNLDFSTFYSKELLLHLETYPTGSLEWSNTLNKISERIKNFDDFLSGLKVLPEEISTNKFIYRFKDPSYKKHRLYVSNPLNVAVIELNVQKRLQAFSDFPNMLVKLNTFLQEEDLKCRNTKSTSILNLIKNTIINISNEISLSSNNDQTLKRLKELKNSQPEDSSSFSVKTEWLKEIIKILSSFEFFEKATDSIQKEIPKFWNQLTFKQKLQVSAIIPIISTGVTLGGIGVAGMGNAVGVPVILVIIVLLFMTNGLIDFLDFLINLLDSKKEIDVSYNQSNRMFKEFFEETFREIFKSDINLEKSENISNFKRTGDIPRDYEFYTVSKLAEELKGIGYVTSQSRDFGIDGYIELHQKKEIILVQSKYYSNKVGFGDATKYLGTLMYWKKRFQEKFDYPISRLIICCPTNFSTEAKELQKYFPNDITLHQIPFLDKYT